MNSTMRDKMKLWAIFLWLAIWELIAVMLGQEILLVSPVTVVQRFITLAFTADFWHTIGISMLRIMAGYFLAVITGCVMAWGSAFHKFVKDMLSPIMSVIKTTPVASFTILLLIWISSANLSMVICFLMVLPIIYTNVLSGIENTDESLLEMAKVFRIGTGKELLYIYLPSSLAYFKAACTLSLGMGWKAGIAAEVIGISGGSIGEKLYEAKLYLDTPDLFAWTVTIVLLSAAIEKGLLLIFRLFSERRGGC